MSGGLRVERGVSGPNAYQRDGAKGGSMGKASILEKIDSGERVGLVFVTSALQKGNQSDRCHILWLWGQIPF